MLLTRIRIALRSCAAQLQNEQQARLLQMIADMLDEGYLAGKEFSSHQSPVCFAWPEDDLARKAFDLRDIQRQILALGSAPQVL